MRTLLVIPAWNEAGRLDPPAFRQALEANPGLEFLFVDDGSTDGTGAVLERIAAATPERVGVMRLPVNRGKGEAVRRGLQNAVERRFDLAGYWDADLATPLEELSGLREPLQRDPRIQVVLGSRVRLLGRSIERRALRHYLGRVFATTVSLALRAPVYDTQCGAKLFRVTAALEAALARPFRSRWVFDVELLGRIGKQVQGGLGTIAVEVPLGRWRDVAGSRVRWSAFVRAPAEIARIWWSELR